MYKIDFSKPIHIHFIGIGGISMSGLAEILHEEGFTISGSDSKESDLTKTLAAKGIKVIYGQSADNITSGIDLVVYTAAIHESNPEFAAAKAAGIPMLTRAELLGQIMDNYDYSIAVAGTHGKTTTTSMISEILLAAQTDPTISVGGILSSIHGNLRVGDSEYFISEACEYTNSFLNFRPRYSIILNIEAEHLDFFKDINDIRHSFREYASNTLAGGATIINGEIDRYEEIVAGLPQKIITYGFDSKYDFYPENITYDDKACASFTAMRQGSPLFDVKLSVPGAHNVSNALAAIALSTTLGLDTESILTGLDKFGGADRRFQYKGKVNGVTIIDDYAHHPTEIRATLTAAQKYPHGHSFREYASNTLAGGATIINGEIDRYEEIVAGLPQKIITYGFDSKYDFYPENITYDDKACASFTAMRQGSPLFDVKLSVPGAHNVSNALAAIALSTTLGLDTESILTGLDKFGGADRRFQYKGKVNGVTIIDDYAHHPTEIRATLTAAQKYPHDRLVLCFQPHTYSRTKAFLNDFADVLSMADVVVLADIYAAREQNTYGISSKDILDLLLEKGVNAHYFPSFEEIEKFLSENCVNGDLLITMGAGNVVEIGEDLLKK